MQEIESDSKGLDMDLLNAENTQEGETLLTPEEEDLQKGEIIKKQIIDKSNFELGIYPPKAFFLDHLRTNWDHSEYVITDTLRVGGELKRRESFEAYLKDTAVRLDENGQVIRNADGAIKGYFQSSNLKKANQTPRHLFFSISEDLLPKKDNEGHFNLGEALHACLMEPTRFSRYVVEPQDTKASNDGCDVHVRFWDEQFKRVLANNASTMEDSSLKYEFAIEDIIEKQGLQKVSEIDNFFEKVYAILEQEKNSITEYTQLSKIAAKIERMYIETFRKEISFGKKASEDPYKIIIGQLTTKKNEDLGAPTRKEPDFNPEPKIRLLTSLQLEVKSFLNQDKSHDTIWFRNLDEKKAYIKAISEATGLESVNENQYLIIKCLELNAKTYGNGIIYKLAKHSYRECTAYLDDYKGTGIPMKVRPDMMQFKENIGVDAIISVKSTSSPNIEKFFYDTAKYQYELSEGMYTEVLSEVTGREFRSVITIMYQTVEPYGVAVFWWKPEDIELGRHKFIQSVQTLKDTLEKGLWPGYDIYAEEGDFGVIDFNLPWWAYKGLEEVNQEGLGSFHPTGDIE